MTVVGIPNRIYEAKGGRLILTHLPTREGMTASKPIDLGALADIPPAPRPGLLTTIGRLIQYGLERPWF